MTHQDALVVIDSLHTIGGALVVLIVIQALAWMTSK